LSSSKLTTRQERFCLEYAKSGNATQAAIAAGYSAKNADVAGARLLVNVRIAERLGIQAQELKKASIADAAERHEFWSTVMRGKFNDMQHRLKASELLARTQGDFVDKLELSGEVKTSGFTDDQRAAIVASLINRRGKTTP
jgi:phage terminase small subunit